MTVSPTEIDLVPISLSTRFQLISRVAQEAEEIRRKRKNSDPAMCFSAVVAKVATRRFAAMEESKSLFATMKSLGALLIASFT
jgi:hypothetical protein